MKDSTHKYEGFKLLSLKLVNHKILGTNTFNFVDFNDTPESIYFSVIIGSNGTGKSELLKIVLWLFRHINQIATNQNEIPIDGMYELIYSNNGFHYTFSNISRLEVGVTPSSENFVSPIKTAPYLLKGSREAIIHDEISSLPIALVANSIMLTDKFIVPRNEKEEDAFPMYKYLGVRNRPQQASTRSYVRKTVEFIVEQRDSTAFKNGLEKITQFLGLSRSIHVLFKTANTTKFYTGNLTKAILDEYFNDMVEKYKTSPTFAPFKLGHYQSIQDHPSKVDDLCVFVNALVNDNRLEKINKSSGKLIRYDIVDDNSHARLKNEYQFLDILREIGLLHAPEVTMKNENEVYLQNSSSGEFHFFSTMVGLMATMKPYSLVIIDEPEISLHPNWQMQYINFLRELFSNPEYKTSQIIIATHSHFLVSDLRGGSSNIIGLKKIDNNVTTIDFKGVNTFGWSAEDVLYNIFDVESTRNFYVAKELGDILKVIAKKDIDIAMIHDSSEKLAKIKSGLKESDPLNSLIGKIQKEFLDA